MKAERDMKENAKEIWDVCKCSVLRREIAWLNCGAKVSRLVCNIN